MIKYILSTLTLMALTGCTLTYNPRTGEVSATIQPPLQKELPTPLPK